MNSYSTFEIYKDAYKKGIKRFRKDRFNKKDPYLLALDDIVNIDNLKKESVGEIDVASELIVGTLTKARKTSFSNDFMPLIKNNSEFASKWMNVLKYHLSDSGITEAPQAIEYLGKFYIVEGNKRVSVLKYFNSPYISLNVQRIIIEDDDSLKAKVYKEFLDYYKKSKLYSIQFNKLGYYNKLIRLIGFDTNYEFNAKDRYNLIGLYERISNLLKHKNLSTSFSDSLLILIEIYGYKELLDMKDRDLKKAIDESFIKLQYDKAYYNILCVGDEEDNSLYHKQKDYFKDIDFILSIGDLKKDYLEYLVTIVNKPLFYVFGNHDDSFDLYPPEGCINIDDDLFIYNGIRILGLGGSFNYRGNLKHTYSEYEMKKRIRKLKHKINKAKGIDIVVAHSPIKGIGDLNDYAHQGFECFKELLDEYSPKYFIFGHVHKNYEYDYKGFYVYKNTQVINVSLKQNIIF